MTAILGLQHLDGVLMLADTEESLGEGAKSECDKLHRFTFQTKGRSPRAGTVVTGGAGDSHLIECANQELGSLFSKGIGQKVNLLSFLSVFAQKFFHEVMSDYEGLRELAPAFPDMLIAITVHPHSWLFKWQGNKVFLVPQYTHAAIGLGIAQLHPMLRDVQFSGTCETMLFHGVRMMFHAKRAVPGVGGQTEAIALCSNGRTRFFGTYVPQQIEDLVRNLDNFCMTNLYTAVSNLSAPQDNIDKQFQQMSQTLPLFRERYNVILNPPPAST
ncbi:MAG: hypothetical protein WAN65_19555 [Candidatus Sulfotelmatobacter sp.]